MTTVEMCSQWAASALAGISRVAANAMCSAQLKIRDRIDGVFGEPSQGNFAHIEYKLTNVDQYTLPTARRRNAAASGYRKQSVVQKIHTRSSRNLFNAGYFIFSSAVVARMTFQAKEHYSRWRLIYAAIGAALIATCASSSAPARDRDAAQQMKEIAREQRQEERRRQREQERIAREQEQRAKELQAEQKRIAAQAKADSAKTSGATSGSSSTSDKASSGASAGTNTSKSSSSSSTSASSDKSKTNTQSATTPPETAVPIEPPRTVQQWLQQLSAPKVKTPAPAPAASVPKVVTTAPISATEKAKNLVADPRLQNTVAPNTAPTTPSIAVKPIANSPSGKRMTGGTPHSIAFPDVPMPEVLAVNATAATVARAKSLGFGTAPATSLASLHMSVTRLLPPKGMSTADARALLQAEVPEGRFAPNLKYRIYKTAAGGFATKPSGVPPTPSAENAPSCGGDRCFAQHVIGWKAELRKCASGLKIGIIDTSVDVSHPTFKRKQIEVRHFGAKHRPGPDWHGTGVAALLAGDDQSTTPGLIPDASFYVADIFYAGENDGPESDTLSMLSAFNWLEGQGVKIINMSLSGPPDALIENAISRLSAKGILLVAAAGNEGPNNTGPSYPAAYDDVIAVTAVNKNLQNYRYANRGSYVDVAAPGVAIWTALPGSQNGYHSGTSFATPYVTASLAAIYAHVGGQNPEAAMQALAFRDLGDAGADPIYGRGLLVAPTSCTGGQIAAAPAPIATAVEPASFFSLFAPATATPKPVEHTEELPWLSLNGARN